MALRIRDRVILAGMSLFLMAGCVTVKVSLFEEPAPLEEKAVSGKGRDKILLMDISGIIVEGPRGNSIWSMKSFTRPDRIKEELEKAAKDDRVKALVLRINSPGGTVSGSDVILHEIRTFKKEKGIPVVACLTGVATSGGYYVAQAGDDIVAYPTCITGSIGVLAMKLNIKGLLDKVGVDPEMVKSGEWKDFWSPFKPASPEEKRIMQDITDSFHRSFVEVVARGRNWSPTQVRKIADGRIFTASQALDLGMVDWVGYLDDAIKLAREKAGLEEARVVRYNRPGSHRPTIYSWLPDLEMAGPQFLYLWWPGEF
ncbi:MAG: signal peptide peptidase SppA [Deltaproteobacteria bacterium]|nr:signal peptide peptidase SppA [Deltaproteobacteria bacterium]